MKILLIAPYLDSAGVGMVINNLIGSIQKYSADAVIDVVNLSGENANPSKYGLSNVDIYHVERLRTAGYKKFTREIGKIIKDGNYDVVHIHTDLMAWIVAKIAKKNNVPVIIGHAHGQAFGNGKNFVEKILKPILQYLNRKYCNAWIGCSKESNMHMFGREGILIPNYVSRNKLIFLDNQEIEETKQEINLDTDKIILGYAGRLNSIKNAIFIPEIYKNEDMKNYQSLFCGGYYEETKDKFAEYGIEEKAVFLGLREDMDRLYNLFDIYVCPSFTEGMSMSLVQSQMMGIPCVVSKGVPKNNDLGLGLFIQCETYDTKEWKENIDKAKGLINSKSQEEIKTIMKSNRLDEESIIEQLISIYSCNR